MENEDIPRIPRRNKAVDDPKMIGLWKVGRTIGTGAQGRVRIARHSKTGQYAAIKIVSKYPAGSQLASGSRQLQHAIEREIVIMKLIDHPNIMRLYDVWETSSDLYLIMEYVEGGELFDHLCAHGRLSTSEALDYFQQIISAVHYCHRFNIAHRDLKPENLLLDLEKNIKLADFGLAAYGANDGLLATFCGSPHYAAPEVISGQVYNGSCSDTWSCGIILHVLLTGSLPFNDDDGEILRRKIVQADFTMPEDIDPLAKDLLSKMLEKDVTKRIHINEVLTHPFYTSQKREGLDHVIPELETIAKPIENLSSIDVNIFANLRTLWPGTPDEEIIECLMNEEKNWQKAIYHLLVDYRLRYLENYDEEEAELERRASRRSKKHKVSLQRAGRVCSMATNLDVSLSSLPPRAEPPTPRRAGRGSHSITPSSDEDSTTDCRISPHAPQIILRSPSQPPLNSPTSPLSSIWTALNLPPLEVPELQDEKIQRFFHQIVDHLNAMQYIASPSPNPSLLTESHGMDVGSRPYRNSATLPRGEQNEKNVDLASSPEDAYGLGISGETKPLKVQRPKRLAIGTQIPRGSDKENDDEGYIIVNKVTKKSSLRKRTGDVLRDKKVHIVEPETERGKLKKKSVVVPVSPGSSFDIPSSPKRTWFDSVFRFKPTNYELWSMHNAETTRSECRRLIMELGANVMLTNAEGLGVLKCHFEEMRDPGGIMEVMNAVKFRVEVRNAERGTEFVTALRFVQEKGAVSSFKMIFSRVRRDWVLDSPGTLGVDNNLRVEDRFGVVQPIYT